MLGHKTIWSRKCGLLVGIKAWDPQDHGINSGLRGTFQESAINSQNRDIGFQISSTEPGIKCQPHPLVLYILWFSSPNAGAHNNLIPKMWPSRLFDGRMVRIESLDPQDHGIKSGLRDCLVFQFWGSKHSDRSALAFASCWSSNCGDQTMRSTRSWDQNWAARHFSWIEYKLAKQRYWFPNKFHWIWDQKSTSSLSFIHHVILIPQCWGTKQSDP
jgi:hypothetical protein